MSACGMCRGPARKSADMLKRLSAEIMKDNSP